MNYLKSAFYVFTWAFVFGFLMLAAVLSLGCLFIPKLWFLVLPTAMGCSVGCALVNTFIHGKPLDDGSVYNPWRFTLLRSK